MKRRKTYPRSCRLLLMALIVLILCFALPVGAADETPAYDEAARQEALAAMAEAETVTADELALNIGAAILVEPQTGAVLFEKDADQRMFPASMTKLMTLVLALEAVEAGTASLDDVVTVSAYAASMGGSQVFLKEGEQFTLDELLIACAVASANDAAVAIGEHLAGSNDAFVVRMNERARELGMKSSRYMNAHGLHDENHYTTARDMMQLCVHALSVPKLLDYTSIKEAKFRDGTMDLYNTNKLLFWFDGTDGLKTGTTTPAGRCLCATAVRDDLRLLSVVMGGSVKNSHFTESMKLLTMGFNQYEMREIVAANAVVTAASVENGRQQTVDVLAAEALSFATTRGKEVTNNVDVIMEEPLFAPLAAGAVVGRAELVVDGKVVDRCELVTAAAVEKMTWLQSLGRFFSELFASNP